LEILATQAQAHLFGNAQNLTIYHEVCAGP